MSAIQVQSRIVGQSAWTTQTSSFDPTAGQYSFMSDAPGSNVEVQTRFRMTSGVFSPWTDGFVQTSGVTVPYSDVSGTPTALSQINSGEGAKLSGITPGADVTSQNTARDTAYVGGNPTSTVLTNISNNTNAISTLNNQTIPQLTNAINLKVAQDQFDALKKEVDAGGSGQLVDQVNALEASARGQGQSQPNLLVNSQFSDASAPTGQIGGWTVGAGSWGFVTATEVGNFVQCGQSNAYIYQDIPITGNANYSLGAEMDPDQAQGCYVKIDWFDNGGNNLGSVGNPVYADGWARGYTPDHSLQAPSSAIKARVYCCISNTGSSNSNGRFTRIQFQRGGVATAYRDDSDGRYSAALFNSEVVLRNTQAGNYTSQLNTLTSQIAGTQGSWLKSQIDNNTTAISTNNTTLTRQINTLSSTITSLGSSNLINNADFTGGSNGLDGWVSFGNSNWSTYNNGSFTFAQSNLNDGDNAGIYYQVSGIQAGRNYCVSFEDVCDNGCYAHMVVQWRDGSNNYISYGPESANANAGWGNRVNNGPFVAPSGAQIAWVMLYPGSGNGTRRLAKVLFQQSDNCTPYIASSSQAALQAQVTQQAGTLADITTNKLQAYWQVTTSAGSGGQAHVGLSSVNGASSFVLDASNVYIKGDVVIDGTLQTSKIADNAVTNGDFIVSSSTFYGQGGVSVSSSGYSVN